MFELFIFKKRRRKTIKLINQIEYDSEEIKFLFFCWTFEEKKTSRNNKKNSSNFYFSLVNQIKINSAISYRQFYDISYMESEKKDMN